MASAFSSGFSVGFSDADAVENKTGQASISHSLSAVQASGQKLATAARTVHYSESLSTASNSTTTLQTKLSLTFSPEANSEYFILSSGLIGTSANTPSVVTSLFDGTTEYFSHLSEGASSFDILPDFALSRAVFGETPGSVTFDYRFAAEGTPFTATLSDCRLLAISRRSEDGYVEALTAATTSSLTHVNRLSLNLDVSSSGDYLLVFSGEADTLSAPHATGIRLTIDGVTQMEGLQSNRESGDWTPIGFAIRVNLAAGARSIIVSHRTDDASFSSRLRNSRLAAIRLDAFTSSWSNSNATLVQTTSTTPQDVVSISATGVAPGNNIIIASFTGGVNGATQSHCWDIVEGTSTELMTRDSATPVRFGSTTIGFPVGWHFVRRAFNDASGGANRTWKLRHYSSSASIEVWTNQAFITSIDLTLSERFGSAFIPNSVSVSSAVRVEARIPVSIGYAHSVQASVRSEAKTDPVLSSAHSVLASVRPEARVAVGLASYTSSVQASGAGEGSVDLDPVTHTVSVQASVQPEVRVVAGPIAHTHTVNAYVPSVDIVKTALVTHAHSVGGASRREARATAAIGHDLSVQASINRTVAIGRRVYYSESLSTSSNATTTQQTKLSLTFSPEPNSEYFILSSGLIAGSSNDSSPVTVLTDGTTEYFSHINESTGGLDVLPDFALSRAVFGAAPGSRTFSYRFATEAATITASLSDCRLLAISRDVSDGYVEALTAATTSSTTYVNRLSLDLDVLVSGYYLLVFSAESDTFSAPHATGIRVTVDGTVHMQGIQANRSSSDWTPIGFAVRLNLSAGTRAIRVDHRTDDAAFSSRLRNSRLAAIRLDTFKGSWSSSNTNLIQTASTTPQDVVSLTGDDVAPGNNIVIASFTAGVNNTSQAHRWDIVEGTSTELMTRDGYTPVRVGSTTTIGFPVGWHFVRRDFSDASGSSARTWKFRHYSSSSSVTVWTNQTFLAAVDLTSPERFISAGIQHSLTITASATIGIRASAIVGHVHAATAIVRPEARATATLTIGSQAVSAQAQSTAIVAASVAHSVETTGTAQKTSVNVFAQPVVHDVSTQVAYTITPGATIVISGHSIGIDIEHVRGTESEALIDIPLTVSAEIHTDRSGEADLISAGLDLSLTYRTSLILIDASAGGGFLDRLLLRGGGLLRTHDGSALLLHTQPIGSHLKAPAARSVAAGYGLNQLVWQRALDPHEVLYFTIDWSEELGGTSDGIASGGSTWTLDMTAVTAGLIIPGGAHSYDTTSATVWLAVHPQRQENASWTGAGETHKITHQVRTVGGQVMERCIRVVVKTLKPLGT